MSAHTVAVIDYAGSQRAAVEGMRDLLRTTEQLRPSVDPGAPMLSCSIVTEPLAKSFSAVLVPPSLAPQAPGDGSEPFVPWLRTQANAGALVVGVCAGAFVLGEAGLLEGRRAAVHAAWSAEFDRRFRSALRMADRAHEEDGDVWTSSGLMSWAPMVCRLVTHLCGPALGRAVSQLLAGEDARERGAYSGGATTPAHSDETIARAERWLEAHRHQAISASQAASAVAMGARTFHRRFVQALGVTPRQYLVNLRMRDARALLTHTSRSIDEIGALVGYEDSRSFRRAFRREHACSPKAYRDGAS
ncbi:MAG: helix-turn-helix domain-containing protein [Myxococcota bacterium]